MQYAVKLSGLISAHKGEQMNILKSIYQNYDLAKTTRTVLTKNSMRQFILK